MLTIVIARQPDGIITRLAMPMLLLTVLAAMSFWAEPADRVGTTMTMLLSISALYIVVFANVPMIGYLTRFDKFVVLLFGILFMCCNLHSIAIRFMKDGKYEKYPLRFIDLHTLVS